MKLTKHNNKLETNIQSESQNFSIGDASVIIEILRNRLYKHKIRTLVQEYICNGRDAMREVNSKESLQIIAPTILEPTFKVRDFGPGITPERMSKVFIQYGSSTKRDSNGQTGGFGIGAKSAWSYTDSFNIITYVDGLKRTYVAHIGVNNQGRLDLISTEETIELNGTEIQVSVNPKDINSFIRAIKRAVYFWPKETYTVLNSQDLFKEKHISKMFNKTLEVVNKDSQLPEFLDIKQWGKEPIASIDGVVYSLEFFKGEIEVFRKLTSLLRGQFVLHLPNGFVEVSASREEVANSVATVNALTQLTQRLYDDVLKMLSKEFNSVNTTFDYLNKYIELSGEYNCDNFSTKDGYIFDSYGNIKNKLFEIVEYNRCYLGNKDNLVKTNLNKKRGLYGRAPKINVKEIENKTLYYADGSESSVMENRRIRAAIELHNGKTITIIKHDDKTVLNKLVDDLNLINLSTIVLPEKEKTKRIAREEREICLHEVDKYGRKTRHVKIDDIVSKYLYVDMINNGFKNWDVSTLTELAEFFAPKGYKICGLAESNQKLIEGNKAFKRLDEYLNNYKLTKAELNGIKQQRTENLRNIQFLKKLNGIKVKRINGLIQIYSKLKATFIPDYIMEKYKKHPDVVKFKKIDRDFSIYYSETYPLLEKVSDYGLREEHLTDIVKYINMKGN